MIQIFVNLKRFDVPISFGGICPFENPKHWAEWIVNQCVKNGLGRLKDTAVTLFFPESLLIPAVEKLGSFPNEETRGLFIGSQGVFRDDIKKGGNFGAFTTNRPAAAVKNLGCSWSIIGHSEERKDKLDMLAYYDSSVATNMENRKKALKAVDALIRDEVKCALDQGLKVILCVGETAGEKGEGSFDEQKPRIEAVLKSQLEAALDGIEISNPSENFVIGYEPIWAIGPGKTPPDEAYISFVSAYIKKAVKNLYGFIPSVVYGGGLKEENAATIAGIETIDGGLIALTRFSGDIGFYPDELKKIVDKYTEA